MRFNFAKRLRMSAQLYILVAVILVMFTGQAMYMMKHVSETEKTLKFTIDNRLKTSQFLQDISDALQMSVDLGHRVVRKATTAEQAIEQLKPQLEEARSNWDNYYLASKIPEEEKLAEATTDVLDQGFSEAEKAIERGIEEGTNR